MRAASIGSGSYCRPSRSAGRFCSSGSRGSDCLAIEIEDPVNLRIPGIETFDLAASRLAHSPPELWIDTELFHRSGEPLDQAFTRVRRNEDAAGVIDIFGRAAQ